MKLTILKTFLAVVVLFFCAVNVQAQSVQDQEKVKTVVQEKVETVVQEKVETVELKVTGMTCSACASKIHNVLKETAGVVDNEVKYPGDVAIIKYDPEKIQPKEIISAIEGNTDFKAELFTAEL